MISVFKVPKPTPHVHDGGDIMILAGLALCLAAIAFAKYKLWSLRRGPLAREHDLKISWPIFRRHAPTLFQARLEFLRYIANEPAWRRLRAKWTKDTLDEFVRKNLV